MYIHVLSKKPIFQYQKECRRKRLADLELKLHDYFLLQESNFEEADQMELRRLKSSIDKMIMKRNTAKYIHSTYIKVLVKSCVLSIAFWHCLSTVLVQYSSLKKRFLVLTRTYSITIKCSKLSRSTSKRAEKPVNRTRSAEANSAASNAGAHGC